MICVFVTFRFGQDFNHDRARHLAEVAQKMFVGMPGLRSKMFSIQPDLREARNVYVWSDPAAARTFFTPDMCDHIGQVYGVRPVVEYGEVAALVDNHLPAITSA